MVHRHPSIGVWWTHDPLPQDTGALTTPVRHNCARCKRTGLPLKVLSADMSPPAYICGDCKGDLLLDDDDDKQPRRAW